MLTPARVYGSWRIIESAMGDESLDQLANTATLPGMANYTMAMPDIHQGYGFPIGGVAAAYADEGMISPGGVGYDIACGVRLMASTIPGEEAAPNIETLAAALSRGIPKGTGEGSSLILTDDDLEGVLADGSQWLLGRGYATEMDVRRTEAGGRLAGAEPAAISRRAWERGRAQLGSLGSGNHFIEIDVVEEIFAPEAAAAMGLSKGMIAIQIHTGSRGLGHQVCTYTLREFQSVAGMRRVDLSGEVPVELPLVVCSPVRIKQILANLLSNAMKFTPAGGWVRVGLRQDGEFVEIEVADNGIGMSELQCKRIFSKFFQVDDSLTREVGGVGLGLALVKKLVELHEGVVGVESTEGKGSRFTIRLPVHGPRIGPAAGGRSVLGEIG